MSGNNNRNSSYTHKSGSQPRTVKKTQGGMRTRSLQEKQEAAKPTLDEVVQQEENALEASLAKAVQEHEAYTENVEETVFMSKDALGKAGYELEEEASREKDVGLTQAVSREELRKAAAESERAKKPQPKQGSSNSNKNGKKKKKKKQKEVLTPKQKLIHAIIGIVIFLIVAGICAIGYLTTYKIFYDVPYNADSTEFVEVTITEDMTTDQIYALLTENELIGESSSVFKARAKIFDLEPVAGKYKLTASYNTEKIINIISGYDYSDGLLDE